MNAKSVWLSVLVVFAASGQPAAAMKIAVIQPGSNRLISHAQVSVLTTGEQPVCIRKGKTGLAGQPCEIENPEPYHATLIVVVKNGDLTGSTRIVYDAEAEDWRAEVAYDFFETPPPDFNTTLGTWKPRTDYQFDEARGTWTRLPPLDEIISEAPAIRVLTQKPYVVPVRRTRSFCGCLAGRTSAAVSTSGCRGCTGR